MEKIVIIISVVLILSATLGWVLVRQHDRLSEMEKAPAVEKAFPLGGGTGGFGGGSGGSGDLGGNAWTEKIRRENPDGTYYFVYKDHLVGTFTEGKK